MADTGKTNDPPTTAEEQDRAFMEEEFLPFILTILAPGEDLPRPVDLLFTNVSDKDKPSQRS